MRRQEISLRKFLIAVTTVSALAAGLGACQKEGTAVSPSEQNDKTQAPSGKNNDDTSNMKQQTDQSGGGTNPSRQ